MTAAVLQGVPGTTFDTDIWVDLPERQYVRVLSLSQKLGGEILARTVVSLPPDTLVNFLFRVDGLKSFASEIKQTEPLAWLGLIVPVLSLAQIRRSKAFLHRPKDKLHILLIDQVLKLRRSSQKSDRTAS